jgi:dodecin
VPVACLAIAQEVLIEPMVNYDVDTDPRMKIYVGFTAVSVLSAAPLAAVILSTLPWLQSEDWGWWSTALASLITALASLITPFGVFGLLLWAFDRRLWRWRLFSWVSGIPNLEGTWRGTLKRISANNPRPETTRVNCYITQTWRKIDFVFEGPVTVGSALTVGMFVENPQDIHVRYIYAMRPKTLLKPLGDLNTLPSEGAAILRLRRRTVRRRPHDGEATEEVKMHLQGTYYSDKMRRGDVHLEQESGERPTEEGPPPEGGRCENALADRVRAPESRFACITELSSVSERGFEDAINQAVARATKTLRGVEGCRVKDRHVLIEDGTIVGYKVNLAITFVLEDPT